MNIMQQQISEFFEKFEFGRLDSPGIPDDAVKKLRLKLIREETRELLDALEADDLIEISDGIADSLYVIIGTAIAYGIDAQRVFDEVHRSNMTKIWPDGKVHRDEHGKVLKPPGFEKPDIAKALKGEGYDEEA